jgi:hypothetical protein
LSEGQSEELDRVSREQPTDDEFITANLDLWLS